MYTIISALATPIIVINASLNYREWDHNYGSKQEDTIKGIFDRQYRWNIGVSVAIFLTGAAAVAAHAMKFQKPTPLILSAMAYRLVAVTLISIGTGFSGDVVTRKCYRDAIEKLKP
jgi:hypothetical protein